MASQSTSGEGEDFALLLDQRNLPKSGRRYYIWKPREPKYTYTLTSSSMDDYEALEYLSRVEHFEDFKKSQAKGNFFSNQLGYFNNTHLYNSRSRTQPKVVWFAPRKDPDEHNFYGNISYKVSMKKIMDCMKSLSINLYFVEIVDFKSTSATRFLFSHKKYDHIQLYDTKQIGGPWYENDNGEHFFAKCLNRRYQPDADAYEVPELVPHEFEIMIEFKDADYSKVFKLCDTEAVDHSDANEMDRNGKPKRKRCKKYQTSDCGNEKEFCSWEWSISHTEELLKSFKQTKNEMAENINSNIKSESESDSSQQSSESDSDSKSSSSSKRIKLSED
ncbi:unnamed protein product [Meganyctiphanes norvegica]|uniref:Uncharacterized protein n=1 Tax=Meganyctiphanes norvegica TaxID=48144 RepID=A0AAV2SV63_MEGNR